MFIITTQKILYKKHQKGNLILKSNKNKDYGKEYQKQDKGMREYSEKNLNSFEVNLALLVGKSLSCLYFPKTSNLAYVDIFGNSNLHGSKVL